MRREADQQALWRVPGLDSMECRLATFDRHAFPPHMHDHYVIEAVADGVDGFDCGPAGHAPAGTCRAERGSLVLIHPFRMHTGRSLGRRPLRYAAVYPSPAQMRAAARTAFGAGAAGPEFPRAVVHAPALAAGLHQWVAARRTDAATFVEFGNLLSEIVARFAATPADSASIAAGEFNRRRDARLDRLAAARALLEARFRENVSLETLARVVGLSPFHLATQFRLRYGLPPHQFLVNARVEHARRLLARGVSIRTIAAEAGFADQAHLTRCFRRRVGLTPAAYARKIVQDPRTACGV